MAIQQKDIQSMLLVVYSISLLLVEKVICSVKIQIFVFIKKKSLLGKNVIKARKPKALVKLHCKEDAEITGGIS